MFLSNLCVFGGEEPFEQPLRLLILFLSQAIAFLQAIVMHIQQLSLIHECHLIDDALFFGHLLVRIHTLDLFQRLHALLWG